MVSYRRLAMRVLGHVPVLFGKKKASPPPRVAAQRIAALALACAMMTGMALPAFAGTYDIANGSIEIHAKDDGNFISQWIMNEGKKEYYGNFDENYKDPDSEITITGKSTGNTVTINAEKGQTANVTLENVEINASSTGQAAVEVTGSGDTNIELNGNNTLTGDSGHAGLEHNKETNSEGKETSGKLTITDTDNNGKLTATGGFGGAGIGGGEGKDGQAAITGGEITASGGDYGAGIGGGRNYNSAGGNGDVTISGGKITARGDDHAAGIGGGGDYNNPTNTGNGNVTISGGEITASGGWLGSGIGGGNFGTGTVTIKGDAIIKDAQGGAGAAGIGGGSYGNGDVKVSGNAIIANAESAGYGSGIGAGQGRNNISTVGKVTIEGNAKIENAKSGYGGSGIGGGAYGDGTVNIDGNATDGKKVTIESAQGGNFGAGIGGGYKGDGNVTIKGNAEIKDAMGGDGGAGIGGGAVGKGTVIIDGNTTDGNTIINKAQGGEEGAGIGGGMGGLGYVTITGNAEIQSAQGGDGGAAGIGGGAESEPDVDGTGKKTGNEISIKSTEAGSPNITAKGGAASDDGLSGGAAIGSGSVYENDDPQYREEKASAAITIEGKVTITATAGGSVAKGDAIAIGDTPLQEQKFAGLLVGAIIKRWDSAGVDLTLEGDQPTNPDQPSKPD